MPSTFFVAKPSKQVAKVTFVFFFFSNIKKKVMAASPYHLHHRITITAIASLTPGLSFTHNLCCKCLNGSCEAIFDIYASRPFQQYK